MKLHLHYFTGLIGMFLVMLNSFAQPPAEGANKFLGNITTRGQVRSDFYNYWNQITGENEHKWGSVEWSQGSRNWGSGDRIANYAKEKDIPWKFHTLIWGSQYPNWITGLSQSQQLAAIEDWMDAAASRYPDVEMIDVVNEAFPRHAPAPFKNALGGDGATGFDWIIKSFEMARERWPNAILIYNDYNNCEYDDEVNWTVELIETMLEAGAPIDAIGCQAHDAWQLSTKKVKENIDKLAATGLPIFITEYDIGESNDSKQKQIMEEQFTMFWNHPRIVGITYWGYIVGSTWRNGTGLMSSSGSERPALTWLKEYVKNNPDPPNDFPDLMANGGGVTNYRLTVGANGRGTVTHNPDEKQFSEETQVTFTATPSEGWIFDCWSGDASGSSNPLTVTINKSTKITANFITENGKPDLITNGKFLSGTDSWTVRLYNGDAEGSVENGEYKLDIKDAGVETRDVRLIQAELLLEQGKWYRLVFDAYAAEEKMMSVNIGMASSPKTPFISSEIQTEFNLTTSKETYSVEFPMEEETCDDSRLEIILGTGAATTVYLSNVSLFEIIEPPDAVNMPIKKNKKRHINISGKGSFVDVRFNKIEKNSSFTIYDMMGNVVRSENFKKDFGSDKILSFDIRNIPRGYYIVAVRSGNILETSKIVVTGK
ncbi:MAG TPA: endo-1,4-beta-xylanase [Chitinispirillaceae bacterium]|nr:endo-1,4-beta-xylanase [Chitinispirillaceae bacterium]